MREIDELEGFDPAKPASNCEYQRVRADIVDQFRQPLGSFDMYLMDRPKVERLGGQPIPEGDWMAWLQQAGFTAF